jgi:hypothetical protein
MDPCQQTDRIERIETAVEKLTNTVSVMASDIRLLSANVDTALKKIDEQERTLRGENGDPGLVAVVGRLNASMDDLYKALRGESEKPGLIAGIDNLVKKIAGWEDDKKWLFRLVAAWVITTILGLIAVIVKQ